MKKLFSSLVLALATTSTALAVVIPVDPPPPQSINPHDGHDAKQRLKLLRNLFGPTASSVPLNCHFSLVLSEQHPQPRYVARHLALVCNTGGTYGHGNSVLFWRDGAAGDNVLTTED